MSSLSELLREHVDLNEDESDHIQRLVRSWGLLADLSFSDMLLFAPARFSLDHLVLLGHVRPTTAQTLYRTDMVGELFPIAERPIVLDVARHGQIRSASMSLIGHDEVRVQAIPVRYRSRTLVVLTRESFPVLGRAISDLERTYIAVFERFARMIADGTFPFAQEEGVLHHTPRVGDGVVVLDSAMRVEFTSPNAVSALHRLGVHANAEGLTLQQLGIDDVFVREAIANHLSVSEEVESGADNTVVMSCTPLIEVGRVNGALVTVRDVSELRRRDRVIMSKDATIREIHHRVKNNLQTISSLLRLQSRRLANEEAKAALAESVRRIASIAVVHETLAHEPGDEAPLLDIVRPLVRMVQEGLVSPDRPIRFEIIGDAGVLPAELTTPLAVVITELLQNVVEHGFPAQRPTRTEGRVQIELGRQTGDGRRPEGSNRVVIRVIDDGAGVPADFALETSSGLGLTIVRTFVENDLGGTIEIRRRANAPGTFVELRVPVS